jgi:hypothetical protein
VILNAFSLNMLAEFPCSVDIREISVSEASKEARERKSAVGHPDTAAVFTDVLGVEVPFNRINVALSRGDVVLVGQYRGPRLPEGCKTLPEGATIKWYLVAIN